MKTIRRTGMPTITKSKKTLLFSTVPLVIFMLFADIIHKQYGTYTNIGVAFSFFGIFSIMCFLSGAAVAFSLFCKEVSDTERKRYYSTVLNWFSTDIKWRKGLLGQGVVDAILQSDMSDEHKSRILFGWCMLLIIALLLLSVIYVPNVLIS